MVCDVSNACSIGVMEPSHFGMRIADLGLQGKNERRTFIDSLFCMLTSVFLLLCFITDF